jgi:hypothetical protein
MHVIATGLELQRFEKTTLDPMHLCDVREECGITLTHFQVIMSKLKKGKVIIDNKLNPHYIPNFKPGDTSFSVLFYYDLKNDAQ